MNKTAVIFLLAFAAAPAFAASTCETRVDQHTDATTAKRVEVCLKEEATEEEVPQGPRVHTEIYSVKYPAQKTKKQNTDKPAIIKKYKKETVNTEFLDQNQYPIFRNDTWPRLNAEEAHEAALEAIGAQNAENEKNATNKPRAKKQTKKPARKITQPLPTVPAQGTAQIEEQFSPAQTSPAQLQQAQATENDPLYQNNTDSGATPAGFNDNLLGPADFGYNDTDPAMQPY